MLNQPPFPHFADPFFLLRKEKRAEWLPDIHSSSTERGKRVQEPAGLLDGENGGGGCQGYLSLRRTSPPAQAYIPGHSREPTDKAW